MKLSTSESGVVKACLEYLHARGIFSWRQNQVAVHGRRFVGLKGVSDILGMVPNDDVMKGWTQFSLVGLSVDQYTESPPSGIGSLLAIETKTAAGRLSPDQKQFGREVLLRGGLYIVARSIDDLREAGL